MYYQMYPIMFTKNYYFNSQFERDLPRNKYSTLEEAIQFARQTKICLREQNWYVYKCSWLFGKVRVSLKSLHDDGLLGKIIDNDDISIIYNWK